MDMPHPRSVASLLATISLLVASAAHAAIGIQPIPDQNIPSGKTLVVPIPATDPGGPARSYTVTVGPPTTSGSATNTAGIVATIRTGDPHLMLGVTYTDSNSVLQTGTMEFQLLREFAPTTAQIIGGLAEGGFYSPQTTGSGTYYITFPRVLPGFVIQGGSPTDTTTGGPGFTFENEFSNALVFGGTAGQLAMANGGTDFGGGTNGSQFFVTLAPQRGLDYSYTIFGQLLRGYDALFGIAGTALGYNSSGEYSQPVNPVNITSATVSQSDADAVLLLSATGVCNSLITVTASSAGSSTVQTFTASAVADTTSDPPFLAPVANRAAPNGKLKLVLTGTDLQRDLLRYGYQDLLPVTGTSIISGILDHVSIPLVSDTDNTIAAALDHWNASTRGPDFRVFQVGAGDKPIRGTLTAIPPGYNGILVLNPYAVAVFTAGNSKDTAAGFTASINWGDGTYLSGSEVSIVPDATARTVNRFNLMAGHTYNAAGEYPVIVNIADPGGATLTLTGVANVGPSTIAVSSADIFHTGGSLKDKVVATFGDIGAAATAADYSATIDWGDGSVSPGIVKSAPDSSYKIVGSHTYRTPATFTLSTSVSRSGASGAATWAAVHIAGVDARQVFPPFPQAHLAQAWSALVTDTNSVVTSTGTSFQLSLEGSVAIVNSGDRTSKAGSIAVYVDASGTLDGSQTAFTSDGKTSIPVQALHAGDYTVLYFEVKGNTDTRLKLPVGLDPAGEPILGVVTYSDPVGDFDGSQKIISPGDF